MKPDGTPDPGFNGGNLRVFTPPGATWVSVGGVDTDPAGNVYLTGTIDTGAGEVMTVVKFTAAGGEVRLTVERSRGSTMV